MLSGSMMLLKYHTKYHSIQMTYLYTQCQDLKSIDSFSSNGTPLFLQYMGLRNSLGHTMHEMTAMTCGLRKLIVPGLLLLDIVPDMALLGTRDTTSVPQGEPARQAIIQFHRHGHVASKKRRAGGSDGWFSVQQSQRWHRLCQGT